MKMNRFRGIFVGALCALLAVPAAAATAAKKATPLLWDIGMEAKRIEVQALGLEKACGNPATTWQASDLRWNEIKPAVESIGMRLRRLESMRAKLPANDQKTLANSQTLFRQIQSQAAAVHALLNRQVHASPVSISMRERSRALAAAARELRRAVA
jgi:hypothetical protein